MVEVPRVARRGKWEVEARTTQREFMRRELAEQHTASGRDLARDDAVELGNVVDS